MSNHVGDLHAGSLGLALHDVQLLVGAQQLVALALERGFSGSMLLLQQLHHFLRNHQRKTGFATWPDSLAAAPTPPASSSAHHPQAAAQKQTFAAAPPWRSEHPARYTQRETHQQYECHVPPSCLQLGLGIREFSVFGLKSLRRSI
jgi:hypothetical protein